MEEEIATPPGEFAEPEGIEEAIEEDMLDLNAPLDPEEAAAVDEANRPDAPSTIVLPKSTILKLMKEAAPDARFTQELQSAINRCCAVFLLYVSDGAQEVAQERGKRTITASEANTALIDSGFSEIAEEVRRVMKLEFLAAKKRKRAN